jgi:hypothetical protein
LLSTSGIITNSAQINNAVITNAKIDNAAVDTLKINGNAVTTARSTGNFGGQVFSGNTTTVTSLSFTPVNSGELFVTFGTNIRLFDNTGSGEAKFYQTLSNGIDVTLGRIQVLAPPSEPQRDQIYQGVLINSTAGVTINLRIEIGCASSPTERVSYFTTYIHVLERYR